MTIKTFFRLRSVLAVLLSIVLFSVASCSDDNDSSTGAPYDPNKPVKLGTFYPDSGGIATKMIITGENFGTDPSAVRVWFNQKRASVVQSIGDRLYVITPRQPGDTCIISVAVGSDSAVFDPETQSFQYTTQITVTTVAGKGAIGTAKMVDGTLSEAEFQNPRYVCVDAQNNLFISDTEGHAIRLMNEEENMVTTLVKGEALCQYPNSGSSDSEGKTIFIMLDQSNQGVVELNPDIEWAPRKIKIHEKAGTPPLDLESTTNWCHSVTTNLLDGMMYFRTQKGTLIKFNPKTKEGEGIRFNMESASDSYLAFHPTQKNLLYIVFKSLNKIMTYNTLTDELEHYAGSEDGAAGAGWEDGYRLDAKFRTPGGLVFDVDGNLFVADADNFCIRKITPDGIVSTVIGIPGMAGFVDGSPDDALFRFCQGVAVTREGVIYVADQGNRAIRKLAIE